jgi:S-methylmethionine-dependent homocysteine/selenocysteine methylase
MIFLMGVASGANQVENITWSARLFPDNPEYVEVYVDARSVASNRVVSTASFDVTFYDNSNRPIKKQVINFLDQKLRNFRAGAYHRFFRHSMSPQNESKAVRSGSLEQQSAEMEKPTPMSHFSHKGDRPSGILLPSKAID